MSKTETSLNARLAGNKTSVPFAKMHGLGNDFVFVHERDLEAAVVKTGVPFSSPGHGQLAARICDRNFGIGADGLIVVREPRRTDCQVGWIYYNSDGSPSAMCGNGLRCLGYWVWHYQYLTQSDFVVDTAVGPVPVSVRDGDHITTVIGEPILRSTDIPVGGPQRDRVVKEHVTLAGDEYDITCVSVGNPHCVIFNSGFSKEEKAARAPKIQMDPFFPEGVNVEFVEVQDSKHCDVYVWERGCGPTLACASGSAAVLVAGVLENRLDRTAVIRLPGGPLTVSWSELNNKVSITGPARISYEGQFDVAQYMSEEHIR
jgi:diaminopimelate epimerase